MPEREPQQQFLKQSETFTSISADENVGKRIDRYFGEVRDMIGYNRRAWEIFAEINYMQIMRNLGAGDVVTDDVLSWFIVQDRLVATALQRRDGFNRTQVALSCYLTPEMLASLRSSPELLAQSDTEGL